MNYWTKLSVEYANQRNYLDDLYTVYPTIPEGIRNINESIWKEVEEAYHNQDNNKLITLLLELDLFPIKDSYVPYLRRDRSAIDRNPKTIARLCGRLREMGLDSIYEKCSEPKETNRQIGPFFRRWLRKKTLGAPLLKTVDFFDSADNAILDASDIEMMNIAKEKFDYKRNKGLDFIARFNNKYVLGEAKWLTDYGGHQNAQLEDGIATLKSRVSGATMIAIFDGVCYIEGKHKLFDKIKSNNKYVILSALVLREYLFQL